MSLSSFLQPLGENILMSSDGVKLITVEEANDMMSRFRQRLGIDQPSPAKQITNGTTHKCAPTSRSGGKPPHGKKPLKPKEDPESIEIQSGGKLPLGEKPNPTKVKEGPKSIKLRSGGKLSWGKKRNPAKVKEGLKSSKLRVTVVDKTSHRLATEALSYLSKKGQCLELVEACLYESGEIAMGYRMHFNFKAKKRYVSSAPVETYFGQLRYYGDYLVVECCVSLGDSDSLPDEPDNQGCQYCTKYVHHPEGGCKGIKWGIPRWSNKKKQIYII